MFEQVDVNHHGGPPNSEGCAFCISVLLWCPAVSSTLCHRGVVHRAVPAKLG